MMVSPPSVLPVLLSVARAAGPRPAAPALAVSPPSVLPVLLSAALAAGSQRARLVSVWAPALAVSAARPAELPPSVLVAVWGLAGLLPLVWGL
jgi:hypothetical protein